MSYSDILRENRFREIIIDFPQYSMYPVEPVILTGYGMENADEIQSDWNDEMLNSCDESAGYYRKWNDTRQGAM